MDTTYEPHAPDWWLKEREQKAAEAKRLALLQTAEKAERKRKAVSVLKNIGKVFAVSVAAIIAFVTLFVVFFVAAKPATRRRY